MFLRSLFLLCLAACVAWPAPQLTVVRTVPSASYSTVVEGLDGAIYGSADLRMAFRSSAWVATAAIGRFAGLTGDSFRLWSWLPMAIFTARLSTSSFA